MNTIRCDNCGMTSPIEGLVNWLQLERIGADTRAWSTEVVEWHFCTFKCVGDWTEDRWLKEKIQ